MARTHYNQNMRFGKLKGEGKKMNACVLFCGNYINRSLEIVMCNSLNEITLQSDLDFSCSGCNDVD